MPYLGKLIDTVCAQPLQRQRGPGDGGGVPCGRAAAPGIVLLTLGLFLKRLTSLSVGFAANIMTAVWAEAYGTAHLSAVRSLSLTTVIFVAVLAPALDGALLDAGMPVNRILAGAVAYAILAAGLGATAHRPFAPLNSN
jgi:hypothetical protein